MLKLNIVIEKDSDGYYTYCPELKGCHSQGITYDEAMVNIREAIELYLETFDEEELKALKSREVFNEIQEFEYA
jgi:predicted RNase H-like HicB family nuclease